MVKAPVKVIVRARPTVNYASKNIFIDELTGKINVNIPKQEDRGYVNHQQEHWGFQFDKVLQNASQEVLFDICAKDIVNSLLEGYSGNREKIRRKEINLIYCVITKGTIMAYGQTGAGKTFTVCGSPTDYKYRGVIPRLSFNE
jgi:kinesin family protein 6/9